MSLIYSSIYMEFGIVRKPNINWAFMDFLFFTVCNKKESLIY